MGKGGSIQKQSAQGDTAARWGQGFRGSKPRQIIGRVSVEGRGGARAVIIIPPGPVRPVTKKAVSPTL